ncbi:ATP-binding protein [Streptomyces sp. NPDC000987]|uniref:ATP-binding protein n=1 Tax=Streptomyces sp. NPDC000987 TaxID=3154374 RepID=UPI003328FE7D
MSLPVHPAPWSGTGVEVPPARPAKRPPPAGAPGRDAPLTATLWLTGDDHGCAEARDFTGRTLAAWELEHRRDDALAVVSELVGNAVLHARPPTPADGTAFEARLKLTLRPRHLVCAVTDRSDSLPLYRPLTSPLQEHGRGLHIVEALSEHWGWTRCNPAGKTVWAMLPTRSCP